MRTTTRRPGAQALFPSRPFPSHANVPHVRCVHGEACRPAPRRRAKARGNGIHRPQRINLYVETFKNLQRKKQINLHGVGTSKQGF